MRQNFILSLYGFTVAFFLFSGTAVAHKVTVFAWVEGDTVYGETKFSGGKKAMDSEIVVLDAEGNELLRTRTNDKGEFTFKVPKRTGLRIELMAGMGHKASWTIPVEEISEDAVPGGPKADSAAAPPTGNGTPDKAPEPPSAAPVQMAPMPDKAELEAMIQKTMDKALEKKLKPIMAILADLEQKEPSVTDVVGGIGYILGLMGVAMYFKARKRKG